MRGWSIADVVHNRTGVAALRARPSPAGNASNVSAQWVDSNRRGTAQCFPIMLDHRDTWVLLKQRSPLEPGNLPVQVLLVTLTIRQV